MKHLLIFEPQTRGHHLSWLRYIAEDFLSANAALTIAADLRPQSQELVAAQLSELKKHVTLISAFDNAGKWRNGSRVNAVADCLVQSGADEIFMSNFDEIASSCLRRAAIGIYPPDILHGKLSGIYFRPRFLENPYLPPGNIIKAIGFRRLCQHGWINRLFFLDETLLKRAEKFNLQESCFLPDTWSGNFSTSRTDARKILNIPLEKFVFLHYGVGDRRKGLHLAIRAMLRDSDLFLLCAGKLSSDREILKGLESLEKRGQAKVINAYVPDDESDICFCACDVVLLPYIRHFGSSGVLSKAAAAGKPVIVSDEGLLARWVRENDLGLLFSSGNADALYKSMREISESDIHTFQHSALLYADSCSRKAFRQSLLTVFHRAIA